MIRLLLAFVGLCSVALAEPAALQLTRDRNLLTISGPTLPGPITINYIEAYCRAGSTNQDWRTKTVIPHKAEVVSSRADGSEIRLRDTLADGVIVDHTITARADEVDFRLTARNPTDRASEAQWAQPCVRIDLFTGSGKADALALVPAYARKCFLFFDGKFTMLPTEPWATEAIYQPGQVYCPAHVDRNDVNPRPLSELVPSTGLCGAFSGDGKQIFATAWEPYQEIFQGVIACLHNDFRIGGLKPGETKSIRGKIYIVPADRAALIARFNRDFPEQAIKP